MRSMTQILCGLGLMLSVSIAGAQSPTGPAPSKKSALELALEAALKNNADLRVAASKLALTEAELDRARTLVRQKVESAYADVQAARGDVEQQLKHVRRLKELKGSVPQSSISEAEAQLSEKKAKLAVAERELNHLQGKSTAVITGSLDSETLHYRRYIVRLVQLQMDQPKTEASDKLRTALRKKATLSCKKATPAEYLALVKKTAGGLNVHANTKGEAWTGAIDADFEDVTIGGMLQYLEDSLPGHQIVVREYGLLIVSKDKVPPGALSLATFLRVEPTKTETKPAGK